MPKPVFTHVLVGWDGSAGAAAGLRAALRLTVAEGCQLTALAVVSGFAHVDDLEDRRKAAREIREPLQQAYDAVIASAEPVSGQHASLEFVEAADVPATLDRYEATHPPDLVVVGLHGREGLMHPKMGHIASHAIRSSCCPVLVVPEPGRTPSFPADPDLAGPRLSHLFHPFRHRETAH